MRSLILLPLLWSSLAFARFPFDGYVEIRPGERLHVEHHPAQDGFPTLFLLNGLTYSTRQWDPFVQTIKNLEPRLGIVTYDMRGMGKTLKDPKGEQNDRDKNITPEMQARDLKDLMRVLNIQGPKSTVALSYGGAIQILAAARDFDFDHFINMAPLLEPMESQDQWIRQKIAFHRMLAPGDLRSDEALYDYYLWLLVLTTYPMAEPVIAGDIDKIIGIYRMVKPIRHWRGIQYTNHFPRGKFHLVAAIKDEYVPLKDLEEFWDNIPTNSRASFLKIKNARHKIPEERPEIAARWVLQILRGHPHLQSGLTFTGDPNSLIVEGEKTIIDLNKMDCSNLLVNREVRP